MWNLLIGAVLGILSVVGAFFLWVWKKLQEM